MGCLCYQAKHLVVTSEWLRTDLVLSLPRKTGLVKPSVSTLRTIITVYWIGYILKQIKQVMTFNVQYSFFYEFEDVPRKNSFQHCPQKNDVSQENWFIFIILVPSKNDKLCPRKSGLSSLYYCLLCLPLCRARCLLFLLKLSWMTTLLGKS